MSLGEIRAAVTECRQCSLCETRMNAVPGRGGAGAEIMFVGEAPGRDEDARGEPFVGAAGRILSAALDKAGIRADSTYITNVVKCRPPGNRVPLREEREACAGHLESEIAAINPRIICVMGNTAFGSLLGGSEIMKFRGSVFSKGDRPYFVCMHPAAAIYNQSLIGILEGDMAELARLSRAIGRGEEVRVDHEIGS